MPDHANSLAVKVTHGPGLHVAFGAVIGTFDIPAAPVPAADDMMRQLAQCLPTKTCQRLLSQGRSDNLPQWVMRVAQAITEARGSMGLPVDCGSKEHRGWVALAYHDVPATVQALRCSLAVVLRALERTDAIATMKPQATAAINKQLSCQPGDQARALMRAARLRGIPVYPVAEGSSIWQLGQGRKGWHCYSSSTQFDSTTGVMLQQDKVQSNALVLRLGFPGVEHRVADRLQQTLALAGQLGYPLVIKPRDSGMGLGVTVNVNSPDEVATAFKNAMRWSRKRQVIVERFVAGNDYRIMVTGSKFQWAIQRTPPAVIGDSASSIAELIEHMNTRVADTDVDKGFAKHVATDDELHRMLASQHMNLQDRPPAGKIVQLRANANVSTGGTYADVTRHVHPDNCAMAETIARAFRLDSVGIDFLSGDIRRSWREGHCAVIEVNATPMQYCDAHAAQLMANKFAEGDNGRIPSALVLCDTPAIRSQLFANLANLGRGVGTVMGTEARLNGCARAFGKAVDAGTAAQALLLDPACAALIAICTIDEVRRHGLPLDRIDVCACIGDAEPDHALHELLKVSCGKTLRVRAESVADVLQTVLMRAAEQSVRGNIS